MPWHRGKLEQVHDNYWDRLNTQQPIPVVLGNERQQVTALHALYQNYWTQGNYPNSQLLGQAGIHMRSAGL